MVDDKAAQVLAEAMLLEPIGLVGLLKLAKLTGKINSLKDCLDRLIENNYRISKKIINYGPFFLIEEKTLLLKN